MSSLTAVMGRAATYSGKVVTRDEVLNSNVALVPSKYAWDGIPPTQPDENGFYPIPIPGATNVV